MIFEAIHESLLLTISRSFTFDIEVDLYTPGEHINLFKELVVHTTKSSTIYHEVHSVDANIIRVVTLCEGFSKVITVCGLGDAQVLPEAWKDHKKNEAVLGRDRM